MRKLLIAFLIFPIQNVWANGPDEMILGNYQSPIVPQGHYSTSPGLICREGANALLLYSKPYSISSLNWNFAAVNYGFGHWGIMGGFRSYALSGLYSDSKVTLGAAFKSSKGLAVSALWDFDSEKFGDDSRYGRADLNLGLS
jgi:hypothetical protein